MHKPIIFHQVELSHSSKTCFDNFSARVIHGSRIGIIGKNGCGKSSLLTMLDGTQEPGSGLFSKPDNMLTGFVPQIIDSAQTLSGGERFNQRLSRELSREPDLLLLDEPTNHLDQHHRYALLQQLAQYKGTLIIASHDVAMLNTSVDTIWHIDHRKITIFNGNYDDYMCEIQHQNSRLEKQLSSLKTDKQKNHHQLMKAQNKAAKLRAGGKKKIENRKWPTVVSHTKAGNAVKTAGKHQAKLKAERKMVHEQLNALYQPESIQAKFTINANSIGTKSLITIRHGAVGYDNENKILTDINFSLHGSNRIAIKGGNGTGKTTLLKALYGDVDVLRDGDWLCLKQDDIGYLDQHYKMLSPTDTVFDTVKKLAISWNDAEIRRYLNDFLFRTNDEVNQEVCTLSGGEKARLSLAQLAIMNPPLLLLDEITNNLDLQTRAHVISVINQYNGGIVVISHDDDFLEKINIKDAYWLGGN